MASIQGTLELIRRKVNEFFKNADPRDEDWVVLSNIVDQEGRAVEAARNKVAIVLANIKHETVIGAHARTVPIKGDRYAIVAPPLYIDLFVLFFANFSDSNYADGLGVISQTIAFFQRTPCFTQDSLPGLDPDIEKLTFEMVNLEMADLNYLMGMLGAKYLPSVLYKVRVLPFRGEAMGGQVPGVRGVAAPGSVRG